MASNSNICHLKRKALVDITNLCNDEDSPRKTDNTNLAEDSLPIVTDSKVESEINNDLESNDRFQNKHPLLAWYKHDLNTGELSCDKCCSLMPVPTMWWFHA